MAESREIMFGPLMAPAAAVAFDKDGTLLATEPFWRALHRIRHQLVAEAAGSAAAEGWRDLMGVTPDGRIDRSGPFALGSFEDEVQVTAVALYRSTRQPWDLCLTQADTLIRRSDQLIDLREAVHPRPGAVEAVLRLKAGGLAVGVVTSDNTERAVAGLRLAGFAPTVFDFVLGADSVPAHKPAPDLLIKASALTGIPPASFAVVGDSRVDMLMARNAGALPVGVCEGGQAAAGLSEMAAVIMNDVCDIRFP